MTTLKKYIHSAQSKEIFLFQKDFWRLFFKFYEEDFDDEQITYYK